LAAAAFLLVYPTIGIVMALATLGIGLLALRGAVGGERILALVSVTLALSVLLVFALLARGGTKSDGSPALPF
jgi:membrane-associated PAP2 superfamily phosphatase